jgi:hypothetical protein
MDNRSERPYRRTVTAPSLLGRAWSCLPSKNFAAHCPHALNQEA